MKTSSTYRPPNSPIQRAADAFRTQYGRGPITDANGLITDPQYVAFTNQAAAADEKAAADALARNKRNWNRVRNTAYVAAAVPFAAAALPALAGGGATGGLGMANTGAWTTSVGAAPGAVGGVLPSTSLIPGALQTPTGGKMGFSSLGNLFKGFTGRDKATLGVGGLNAVLDYRGKGNQLSADERALEYQRKSDAEMRALLAAQRDEDYQRELVKEAALQKRFDAEQLALQTRSDAQEKRLADQYNAREARMSPYREAGRTSLARIANIQAPTITPYTPSLVYRS